MKWKNVTLYQYQQVVNINGTNEFGDAYDFDKDIDNKCFTICALYGLTEFQVNNTPIKKLEKLVCKVAGMFSTPPKVKQKNKIGKYFIKYDISKMTFGQFIELSFFLSLDPIQNGHRILASISNRLFRKNDSNKHGIRCEYFLNQSVPSILGSIQAIQASYLKFMNEYKSLFGLDEETNGKADQDLFQKKYGWMYAASQIAEYEKVPLENVFKIPVRHAMHDLTYLKAKAKYEAEQLAKMKK